MNGGEVHQQKRNHPRSEKAFLGQKARKAAKPDQHACGKPEEDQWPVQPIHKRTGSMEKPFTKVRRLGHRVNENVSLPLNDSPGPKGDGLPQKIPAQVPDRLSGKTMPDLGKHTPDARRNLRTSWVETVWEAIALWHAFVREVWVHPVMKEVDGERGVACLMQNDEIANNPGGKDQGKAQKHLQEEACSFPGSVEENQRQGKDKGEELENRPYES